MFDTIAARYDRLNRLLSLGVDGGWRRRAVRAMALRPGAHVLDVATGTGDMLLALADAQAGLHLVGIDPAARMLDVARRKIDACGLDDVAMQLGDAQALPFADRTFDATCIAFGIRNVPDRARGLAEMARVTKRGGRVVVLELTEPRGLVVGALARFYIRRLVPWVGALLSRQSAYRYLERSIAAFPAPDVFARMMQQAGLAVECVEPLTFGVCHLFVGVP